MAAVVLLVTATALIALHPRQVIDDLTRWSPPRLADRAARAWLGHRDRTHVDRLARGVRR